MARLILDRIEGDTAVLETESGKMICLPLSKMPKGIKSGDVFDKNEDKITFNAEQTALRRERMNILKSKLFKK